MAAGGVAGWEPGSLESYWSPYQKLVAFDVQHDVEVAEKEPIWWTRLKGLRSSDIRVSGETVITVNNAGYQGMIDLDPARVATNPAWPATRTLFNQ